MHSVASFRRIGPGLVAAFGLTIAVPVAATVTLTVNPHVQTYRAPDGSQNYTSAYSAWGTTYPTVGVETGITTFPGFTGRSATTLEFDLSALPTDAIITSATLTLYPLFASYSTVAMNAYVAEEEAFDPSRASAGILVRNFSVSSLYPADRSPSFDVTSAVSTYLPDFNADPILGFSFRQIEDVCSSTVGNSCISTLGSQYSITLDIAYDSPAAPPTSEVPETATWAMMLAGFLMIGGVLRQRSRQGIMT